MLFVYTVTSVFTAKTETVYIIVLLLIFYSYFSKHLVQRIEI